MSEDGKTIPQIENCLARLAQGDSSAWDNLMEHAFPRLLQQCARIVQRELSRPNPMITENAVLAEAYKRLRTAMQRENVRPKTAREFFGLAARNIRWQIQDMVRRPAPGQVGEEILAALFGGKGVETEVIEQEKWRLFWETIDKLTDDEREVFDLVWINGLSQNDAAAALGKTRNQVDSVWRKIKMKIAKSCQDFFRD